MKSNILFVVDYYQPKIGYGSYWIPKSLIKLGHEVTIFTSNYYYPFPNYNETAGKILGPRRLDPSVEKIDKITIIRRPMVTELFTRAIFNGQVKVLKDKKPDIVIVDKTASYQTIVFCLLKSIYNYKLVSIDAHLPSGFKAEGNQFAKELFYKFFRLFFSNLVNKKVNKFIAVQEKTKVIMKKYYGITKKIDDIPLGTDLELYKFNNKWREKIRTKYKIKKNDFVVIYTGKIIKEKGVHLLFEAVNKIFKQNDKLKLLLLGSADKEYEVVCKSKLDKKYWNNVVWVGFTEAKELYKYYSASDLGVWPLQESMAMNDAASCSLPFIANHTIGARLRLSNNNALLYKKGNSSDLADKIEILLNNKKMAKEMGIRGRKLMETRFSWDEIAKEYINL